MRSSQIERGRWWYSFCFWCIPVARPVFGLRFGSGFDSEFSFRLYILLQNYTAGRFESLGDGDNCRSRKSRCWIWRRGRVRVSRDLCTNRSIPEMRVYLDSLDKRIQLCTISTDGLRIDAHTHSPPWRYMVWRHEKADPEFHSSTGGPLARIRAPTPSIHRPPCRTGFGVPRFAKSRWIAVMCPRYRIYRLHEYGTTLLLCSMGNRFRETREETACEEKGRSPGCARRSPEISPETGRNRGV